MGPGGCESSATTACALMRGVHGTLGSQKTASETYAGRFFFSSRRRHTRWTGDWSSDVCSSDLKARIRVAREHGVESFDPGLSGGIDEIGKRVLPEKIAAEKDVGVGNEDDSIAAEIGRASCRERV